MDREVLKLVRSLGTELSPAMMKGTQQLFAARAGHVDPAIRVSRDLSYGPDVRHRLDVFSTEGRGPAPVLVFVHGGGFVMGDKRTPGSPFYDNVGAFAVRAGCIGVTLNYRLAPAHPWPAGSEDLAAAVAWLRSHVQTYGGDPEQIFLMGQSAGAVHVAGYVATSRLHSDPGTGIAGALMISGVYDVAQADVNPFQQAYYGVDQSQWGRFSTLDGLVSVQVPLFFSVCEYDAADFQRQAAFLTRAWVQKTGRFPPLHWLAGHNHLSPVLAIGSPADTLGPLIRDFILSISG